MAVKPSPADCVESTATAAEPAMLGSYTCIGCGHRSASWTAFRTHRTACSGRLPSAAPGRRRAPAAPPPEPEPPAEERDPFLDAPPEALDALQHAIERAQGTESDGPRDDRGRF